MTDPTTAPSTQRSFPLARILTLLVVILVPLSGWLVYRKVQQDKKLNRPLGLEPLVFQPLPLGAVRPEGWLLDQMRLQADGLSGHLDEFWPDVQRSGWIGGDAEGWERAPYWLDGLIPLAFLTDDARLKAKAKRWVDYILQHQQKDGWLGPSNGRGPFGTDGPPPALRDPWPQFVILKALAQYAEVTGDSRIVPAMTRDLEAISAQLDSRRLFDWNFFRYGDLLVTIYWLYDRTQESWLLQMAYKVAGQGYNWPKHFEDLPVKEKSPAWNWQGHVVNNAMGLKVPGLFYRLTDEDNFKKDATLSLEALDRYHGEPNGLFSGDECLAGRSPSQGTELCAIVETMYSLETDLSVLGDCAFADRLEKIAFNALPAAFSPDYWEHQYDEQSNQVACFYVDQPVYTTNRGMANLFGLEPQFGCCTANYHQGWPKFVSHLWMASQDGGLVAALYAPCRVEALVAGVPIQVEVQTQYPFREDVSIRVHSTRPVEFPLLLRVPRWAQGAWVDLPDGSSRKGTPGGFLRVQRNWNGTEVLHLHLPMAFKVRRGFRDSVSVERGPLVFSLGLKEEWKPARPFPYRPKGKERYDYFVLPTTPWNYALELDTDHPERSLSVQETAWTGEDPFTLQGAPVRVNAKGKKLPDWAFVQGAAEPPPPSPVTSTQPAEDLVLVPYGSTRLRVTEFPLLKN